MITSLRYAMSLYMVSLSPVVISIVEYTENPTLYDFLRTLLARTAGMFFWVNLLFYLIELAIFGEGFAHFGDALLLTWLLVRMVAIGYQLIRYSQEYLTPNNSEQFET